MYPRAAEHVLEFKQGSIVDFGAAKGRKDTMRRRREIGLGIMGFELHRGAKN